MPLNQQPALHELVTVMCAPTAVVSEPCGRLDRGACGFFRQDRRALATARFEVDGTGLIPVGHRLLDAGHARFQGWVRPHDDLAPDPTTTYLHERRVDAHTLRDSWTLSTRTDREVCVRLRAATDLAPLAQIKAGELEPLVTPEVDAGQATWAHADMEVTLRLDRPADHVEVIDDEVIWTWDVALSTVEPQAFSYNVTQVDHATNAFDPRRPEAPITLEPVSRPADGDQARLLAVSLQDLAALQLTETGSHKDAFLAAGSPWFFTMFGRDSLLAARLLLPFSTELASGTVRALAARQGKVVDRETEEQPGKILHEVRRVAIDVDGGRPLRLPPEYYGTIDATPLWICLLHDAWQAGMPEDEVRALIPALEAAMTWLWEHGDADGDGFLEYEGSDDAGLANQGWKDSSDGVRWADGTIASRPLALCEVQGYAYEAATSGAALLEAFGHDGSTARAWAADLQRRFRETFWVEDEFGRYPAIALDGQKRPVTGPASNMAHLLGTGLLDHDEATLVARQLTDPGLSSGYGLRTLSAGTAGFNPFSYHCGSVWPHDTAIAVLGLAAEGLHDAAAVLAEGLVRAGVEFDYRMPELFSGNDFRAGEPASAYPASCRPQAWSAAGAAAVVHYLQERRVPSES